MLFSTPSTPKPKEAKSILLIGPPGGGKTALLMQFPQVAFLDCDRNLDGPELFIRSKNKELSYGYIPITYDEKGKAIPTHECYDRIIETLGSLKGDSSIQTVGLDGLTMINEFIIQSILKSKNISELETRHWDTVKSKYFRMIATAMRDLGKTTIISCHEKAIVRADKDPKNMMEKIIVGYEPHVQSGIREAMPGFFTDVWRCYAQPAPGDRREFVIQTEATPQHNFLKNSMMMEGKIVVPKGELAWEKIKKYFL